MEIAGAVRTGVRSDNLQEVLVLDLPPTNNGRVLRADADGKIVDATGLYVSPGFIDIHVHGGRGSDTIDGTIEDILNITTFHAHGGTTSMLPTTASDSLERLLGAICAVREAKSKGNVGARILGVHLEGPYFNLNKKGCHKASEVRNPNPEEYEKILMKRETCFYP